VSGFLKAIVPLIKIERGACVPPYCMTGGICMMMHGPFILQKEERIITGKVLSIGTAHLGEALAVIIEIC